jgi:hypothetical protein
MGRIRELFGYTSAAKYMISEINEIRESLIFRFDFPCAKFLAKKLALNHKLTQAA